MKRVHWSLQLKILLASTLFGPPPGALAEVTPYLPEQALDLGQGFNTFTGKGALLEAVKVEEIPDTAPNDAGLHEPQSNTPQASSQGLKIYHAKLVDSYMDLVKTLGVSASAQISGFGQSASISANYLDKGSFEASTFTYLIEINVQQQPSSRNRYSFNWDNRTSPEDAKLRYGDRFVKDFITGGAYYARVSIFVEDKSHTQEVGAAAEAAFGAFGVIGGLSAAVNESLSTIGKFAKVTIDKMSFGELSPSGMDPSPRPDPGQGPNPVTTLFLKGQEPDFTEYLAATKAEADAFWIAAGQQKAKLYAIIAEYTILKDFYQEFDPPNYETAKTLSWPIFSDFKDYEDVQDLIKSIPDEEFNGGRETRDRLNRDSSKFLESCRTWVRNVAANPSEDMKSQPRGYPLKFRGEVLHSVQTLFIGESVGTDNDVLDTEQRPGETVEFEVAGFRFPVPGTVKLTFGTWQDRNWRVWYLGKPPPPEYTEEESLWVSDKLVPEIFTQIVYIFEILLPLDHGDRFRFQLNNGTIPSNGKFTLKFFAMSVQ